MVKGKRDFAIVSDGGAGRIFQNVESPQASGCMGTKNDGSGSGGQASLLRW